MFDKSQNLFALIARVLMAALFLPAGISKIAGFAGTVGYIGSVGLPMPEIGAAIAVVVEVGGALALLLGFHTRWAALLMALFTVVAGVFFHAFWNVAPEAMQMQQIMFMKNIAIAGGLLALTAFGAGSISLDARKS
jgi:putative oxidoreductase